MANLIGVETTTNQLTQAHTELALDPKNVFDSILWHDVHDHMILVSALLSPELDPRINRVAHILGQGEYVEIFLAATKFWKDVVGLAKEFQQIFEFPKKMKLFQQRIDKYIPTDEIDPDFNYAKYLQENSVLIAQSIINSRQKLGEVLYKELVAEYPGQVEEYDDYFEFIYDVQWGLKLVDTIPEELNVTEEMISTISNASTVDILELINLSGEIITEKLSRIPSARNHIMRIKEAWENVGFEAVEYHFRNTKIAEAKQSPEEFLKTSYAHFYKIHKEYRKNCFSDNAEELLGRIPVRKLIEGGALSPYILPQTSIKPDWRQQNLEVEA